jgi:hypothetical protein
MAAIQLRLDGAAHHNKAALSLQTARQTTLDALGVAIGLAYENVRPDAAGVVNAWEGRYGKRGALSEFVATTFLNASPNTVSTTTLINRSAQYFSI